MEFAIKQDGLYVSVSFSPSDVKAIQTQGKGFITLQAKVEDNEFTDYSIIAKKDDLVTKIDFPSDVTLRLVSKQPFNYTLPGISPKYYNKKKVDELLYEITYGNIDYSCAYEYFNPVLVGGCSAIRNGSLLGRNFDWLYDNEVQFIVNTPSSLSRYAVIGISGIVPGITKNTVDQEKIEVEGVDMFKLLPFYLLDGINEKGVFCTQNIVPLDDEDDPTTIIRAKSEEVDKVCISMLPRYILDKFSSAEQAIRYITDHVTLFFTSEMIESGYQSHVMLGDINSTYILEFVNGEMKVIKNSKYITNFNISDVEFNKDGTVKYPPTESGINKYGFGLERWDMIAANYTKLGRYNEMFDMLESLKYSNCYTGESFWCSELVKGTDDDGEVITVDTLPEKCSESIATARQNYASRSRTDPKVWITSHSSIYDISKKRLYLRNQEGETIFNYELIK